MLCTCLVGPGGRPTFYAAVVDLVIFPFQVPDMYKGVCFIMFVHACLCHYQPCSSYVMFLFSVLLWIPFKVNSVHSKFSFKALSILAHW